MSSHTKILTTIGLCSFAANSILCRFALEKELIDPASFTTVRLVSGAVALWIITRLGSRNRPPAKTDFLAGFILFLYAITFSFAYIGLSTGTGALILFGLVQASMIVGGYRSGERPSILEWVGLLTAFSGLVILVFPGVSSPPPVASILMGIAGVSWGAYSLRGKRQNDPVHTNSSNFIISVPFTLLLTLVIHASGFSGLTFSIKGLILAALSGAVTSGLGYAVWYAALRGLSSTSAGIVQIAVPVLAALGGVIFLSEQISLRLVVSAITVLGGISMALSYRHR